MNLLHLVQQKIRDALKPLVADPEPYVAMVKPVQDPKHGDYQANCAMSLAKVLSKKPRDVAQEIVQQLTLGDFLEPPEIAGPGFINLRIRKDWLAARLQEMARDDRLGVAKTERPETVVIDYSSPNVAKPMHVGHLRSTIIGDAIARLLRFQGHTVIADNHLGDWGTQFGMLLYGYKNFRDEAALKANPVQEMVRLYIQVRQLMKPAEEEDEDSEKKVQYTDAEKAKAQEVADAARQETAKLHTCDPENQKLWEMFLPWCMGAIQPVYERLDIHFDHFLGESYFNPMLPGIVQEMLDRGIARPSKGAIAIFLSDKEGETPALIQKRDGAFTYMTTDLATLRHRVMEWKGNQLLYVVGAPQALHFQQLFEIGKRWGYDQVKYEHIAFGSVLERLEDGTTAMFRTRGGRVVELSHLLDEAVVRAGEVYEKNRAVRIAQGIEVPELSEEEKQVIAEVVGLGAVKYADLCQNRTSDYIFDWDKMLAMEGNTAAYMQYAYVRNRGIFRKGDENVEPFRENPPQPTLEAPEERALALQLLRLSETLEASAQEYRPNVITAYLWDVAKSYSRFFDKCHVLNAETPELRRSRLLLCDLTGRVIQLCLQLLGIRTVERM